MRTVIAAALFGVAVAGSVAAESVTYTVLEDKSAVTVHVGKSGAFSFAGHRHDVRAPVSGTVTGDATSVSGAAVDLRFAAARLRVVPEGEPAGDAPKVQEAMEGPKVLDAARFPEIRFVSKRVEGQLAAGSSDLTIVGDLSLHGMTRELRVPVKVVLADRTLTATGRTTLRHDDFGMKPVSAAGGAVKVANEIGIDFQIVAERR